MKPHNIISHFIFILIIILVLSQCGLNSYPYLYPPDLISRSTDIFSIGNRADNDPDVFLGYELYYKFYDSADPVALINDDRTLIAIEQPTPADVTRLGFRRVNTVDNTDLTTRSPMIPVDYSNRSTIFNITFNFTGVADTTAETIVPKIIPEAQYLGSSVSLYRQVTDPDDASSPTRNKYKSFGDLKNDDASRDTDIPQSVRVTLSLYIFAYGKYDRVYNIYSKPLWLGSIEYLPR